MSESITNCRNCNQIVNDNFCAKCGHAVQLKRIDGHYIWHEIVHVLHFEKGIFYTVRELVINPGKNIRAFITSDRDRLVKPVIFIIITSLIYTLVSHFFHNQDSFIKIEVPSSAATDAINRWIHQNYGYSNILEGLFIALWLKIFFRKSDYNFYEIVILLCFTMGIGMLIFALAVILTGLIHVDLLQASGMVFFVYITWAIGQFFDGKKIMSYVKALAAYALGMGTFLGLAMLLGNLIDLIMA
jgi:hypothetical protein